MGDFVFYIHETFHCHNVRFSLSMTYYIGALYTSTILTSALLIKKPADGFLPKGYTPPATAGQTLITNRRVHKILDRGGEGKKCKNICFVLSLSFDLLSTCPLSPILYSSACFSVVLSYEQSPEDYHQSPVLRPSWGLRQDLPNTFIIHISIICYQEAVDKRKTTFQG